MNAATAQRGDRAWIESHIPHQGTMCLLDRVERWDDQEIVCITHSHSQQTNPLHNGDSLGITTAIEYAAQATAVHSALLLGDKKLGSGFLASARNVQWSCERLDDVDGELCVHATRISGNDMTVLYAFAITVTPEATGAPKLIEGRVSIFLDSAAAQPLANNLGQLSL